MDGTVLDYLFSKDAKSHVHGHQPKTLGSFCSEEMRVGPCQNMGLAICRPVIL